MPRGSPELHDVLESMEIGMRTLKLDIKIKEIDVDSCYYSIRYKYRINGCAWKEDKYSNGWGNDMTTEEWREALEEKVAMEYVLQQISENLELSHA